MNIQITWKCVRRYFFSNTHRERDFCTITWL